MEKLYPEIWCIIFNYLDHETFIIMDKLSKDFNLYTQINVENILLNKSRLLRKDGKAVVHKVFDIVNCNHFSKYDDQDKIDIELIYNYFKKTRKDLAKIFLCT